MKQVWEIKKLGEVCEFKSGTTIDSKLEERDGEIIYAKVGDMNLAGNEDYITVSSRYVALKNINQNQIIPVGSIIFPKRGGAIATNKKRRIIQPTIVDLNTMALVPSKIIDNDYLFFWFQQIDLSDLSNGTSIPQINNYSFDDVCIPLPPLPEQQRIVAILDETFAAIAKAKANAEQNLRNAKELFESYLQSVFENKGEGWEEKKLGEIARLVDSLHQTPKYSTIGFPMVRVTDIKPGNLDLSKAKKVDKKIFDEFSKKHTPAIGDIVLSRVGSYGVSAIVNTNEQFCLGQNTVFIIPQINSNYFYYFLNSPSFKKQLDKMVAGTTQPTVSLKSIKEVIFPVPITKEQQVIVQKLDALSAETKKLETIYQQKINDLEELKKSILQKAFSGELKTDKDIAA